MDKLEIYNTIRIADVDSELPEDEGVNPGIPNPLDPNDGIQTAVLSDDDIEIG